MCGRFTETLPGEVLEQRFHATFKDKDWHPTYNAAPSQSLPVILSNDPQSIVSSQWGITPAWLKERGTRKELINARAETLSSKPTFKSDFSERRCLVLADGFYEWKQEGRGKVPYRIMRKDKAPFAFAGLWRQIDGGTAFVIITVEPNELMAKIHNRMPAILLENSEQSWLNTQLDLTDTQELLLSYPDKLLKSYPVSTLVNDPSNNIPTVIEPVKKLL